LQEEMIVVPTGCNGFCENGPLVLFQPEDILYRRVRVEDIPLLVEEHCLKGRPVPSLMYVPPGGKSPIPARKDIEFFKHQKLVVLRNRGRINPENINDYIAFDGYMGLAKALREMTPEEIIEALKVAGLRGRGGAGFPTFKKLEICRAQADTPKYLICNADEGDPGAFMDRSILEADPHAVIEGMAIGAKAIGAQQGFVYVRMEYPLALERVKKAIAQAEENGLLGDDILGSGLRFNLSVVRGAGAFVCGEETALMSSIEGKVGRPRPRPPFPAVSGLWGKPTNINNVETWANVAQIMLKGGEWFSEIGTEKSKGTKVFSLVGKINNTGLVEVPMGITMKEIVYRIGGGIPGNRKLKAVQTGGPSGGCVPASLIDMPIDYESLSDAGSMMGSGGLVVMDEKTCMVDIARYFTSFLASESCGKCSSCRVGLVRMLEILTRICDGKGGHGDVERLEELGAVIKETAMCGLGQTSANPVLSTIRYFRDEYDAHIKEHRCPAGFCKELITYGILEDKCVGCGACSRVCPTGAVSGQKKQVHRIDTQKCIKCGACSEVCKFDAVQVR
ncbi:MAG TPA: NADH-ubiquinone oxidoreductase-F iron-sulfur binding region domain-containing protein, partial [bacterium]|nr:NADH-ubiquinone oxidoreductase-F iron-sulfur binding region domain-containing protein [bacterium]